MLSCILGSMKLCSVLSGAMHSRRYIELNINLYRLLLVVNDDCEDAEMVARRNKLLADSTDYLNEADDCGASVTCGDIESGDETEKVDVEIGEYDSYGDLDELVAPDDISDDPDEHDAAECSRRSLWRGRFGGEDEVLARNMKNDISDEIASVWVGGRGGLRALDGSIRACEQHR